MILPKIKERIKLLKNRDIFNKIITFLKLPDIIVLIGMRQTGKTSLLYLIIKYLLPKIPEGNIFYFSLEDPIILNSFNQNIKELEIYLNKQVTDKQHKLYILIDEIQYLKNPTNFLKYYYDNFPNYKFIVTGSSTFEIRKKFKDSLTGRKKIIHINPLSFKEFLYFKDKKFDNWLDLSNLEKIRQTKISKIVINDIKIELEEYLLFGGHPKVVNLAEKELKLEELKEIYNAYLRRDIKDIGNIENIGAYNQLIQILSSQIGNLVNIQELSNTINLNQITLKKYIFLLENSFVIHLLKPYFKNKRKEVSKMPKIYFTDIGIRNMIISDFRKLMIRTDGGALVENFIFNELDKQLKVTDELFFWRKISKEEVDFILKSENELIPIEVKYQNFKQPKINMGMKSFITTYSAKKAIVVTKDYLGFSKFNECEVYFIPLYLI